jgi:large conductance mechanosensitive channel
VKKFLEEFKAFALKGNVMDLAIGVVIGAAFSKIVSAMVDNVIMPIAEALIKLASKDFDYTTITFLGMKIGLVIGAIINFAIVALFLFLVVKAMNKMKSAEAAKPAPPPEPTAMEKLLAEIRDNTAKR